MMQVRVKHVSTVKHGDTHEMTTHIQYYPGRPKSARIGHAERVRKREW
jgi:hypothetical protein